MRPDFNAPAKTASMSILHFAGYGRYGPFNFNIIILSMDCMARIYLPPAADRPKSILRGMDKGCISLLAGCVLLTASAYAAPKTVIASLRHIIRNPGTYFLKSDLSVPASQTGIQTTTAAAGHDYVELRHRG
jgi:hypothetical protein